MHIALQQFWVFLNGCSELLLTPCLGKNQFVMDFGFKLTRVDLLQVYI